MSQVPETRYGVRDDLYLAYQVVGEGPRDIVLLGQARLPIDLMWDDPWVARGLRRLCGMGRLIAMDLRGWGASSAENLDDLPVMEAWMDDIGVVMDAAGSERAVIFGFAETGLPAMLFAASHPDRTESLVLYAAYARFLRGDGYPYGLPPEKAEQYVEAYRRSTGRGMVAEWNAPSRAGDPAFRRWWARGERLGGPPSTVSRIYQRFQRTDVTGVLSSIQAPTLVLRRTGDRHVRDGHAQFIADRVPNAELVELPGDDHAWYSGDTDAVFDEIERFLTGASAVTTARRTLATVLFTDIVDSTTRAAAMSDDNWVALLASHDEIVRNHVGAYDGEYVKSTGDGALAVFDGPARALYCAEGLRVALRELGLESRMGLHTGEIERVSEDVRGIAVHIAARVAAMAAGGEIWCSRTVGDLVVGSGIGFEPRGVHELKGVPGEWPLYAARA